MLTLPAAIITLLQLFSARFDVRTWRKAHIPLAGAIIMPGKRTVTSALRVMGLTERGDFALYHDVLNRAVWSSLNVSRELLNLLIPFLVTYEAPLVFGIDESVEGRRGRRIRAKGIYRDAVRSSASHLVKTSGLRWVSLMWLAPTPWAKRDLGRPLLTVLAPSERYYQVLGWVPKKLTDWAGQIIIQLRRWLPYPTLVIAGDSSYAVLDLLHLCQSLSRPVTLNTRLRLDAALFEPAPPRRSGQVGRPRLKGGRLSTLKELLCQPKPVRTTASVHW